MLKRGCGILAHPTSFATNFGIGDLGKSTEEFLEFLEKSNQKYWQILPIGPTSFYDSPYQSFSTFAGNTLLISPELLVEDGYLDEEDLVNSLPKDFVEYGDVIKFKDTIFKKAFNKFLELGKEEKEFKSFINKNKEWLNDYSLFISLKKHYIAERENTYESGDYLDFYKQNKKYLSADQINDYFYGGMWLSFEEDIKNREPKAIKKWQKILEDSILYEKFLQYKFFEQWSRVKKIAKEKKIQIIGDIPIFVSMDSCDVWANKHLFFLDDYGRPTKVAGVPPDYFSEDGQLWGNPLFDFSVHKQDNYKWWLKRFESSIHLYDVIRIDHFRGFADYWAVPFGKTNAVKGKWEKGPSKDFFDTVLSAFPKIKIIAEDLGILTDEVLELRDHYNFPGMKIIQFAFSGKENLYLPHNFSTSNCIVYTGTHDNDTTKGFYEKATEEEKDYIRRYMNISGENIVYDLIRLCYSSSANICIIPVQDVLELDSFSRMNKPSKKGGNWQFRFKMTDLDVHIEDKLNYLVTLFNR